MQNKLEVIQEYERVIPLLSSLDISLSDLLSESIEDIENTLEALEKEYHI